MKFWLMALAVLLLALLAAAALGRWMHLRDMDRLENTWQSLEQAAQQRGHFDSTMVQAVPEPARRFLLAAIEPGAPLVDRIVVELPGRISLDGENWLPMEGRELMAPLQGYVWIARVGQGAMRMRGGDFLHERLGRVGFWLWGMIPVASSGPSTQTGRSGAGRAAAEAFLLPTVLLPEYGTRWEAVDDSTAIAHLKSAGEEIAVHFRFDEEGLPRAVWLDRWKDNDQGELVKERFGGDLSGRLRVQGLTLPAGMVAGWGHGSEEFVPFFDAEIVAPRLLQPDEAPEHLPRD